MEKKIFMQVAITVVIGIVIGSWILMATGPTKTALERPAQHAPTEKGGSTVAKPTTVEMSDETLKGAGVDITAAGPARITISRQLPGEIAFNRDRLVHVVPRFAGVVVASPVMIGHPVHQGELLLSLESQALAELRGQLAASEKRLVLAKTTYEREKSLWEQKISAEQDYLAARQVLNEMEIASDTIAQKLQALGVKPGDRTTHPARYELRSPIDGIVMDKAVASGEFVKEDVSLFTIADLTTVWAEIILYAKDLNAIKVGQAVTVQAVAFDARTSGTVAHVGALLGEQTRTASAHVILKNPGLQWRPGMFVNVDLTTQQADVPVAVFADAIQTMGNRSVVFVRRGNFLEARPVDLGRRDGTKIEVLKGLSAGDNYAAGNTFAIKAELGKAGATHDD